VAEGLAGQRYTLRITHYELVQEATGGTLQGNQLTIQFPSATGRQFVRQKVVLKLK
jgi:hypothetical protein